jgi:DNA polymerase I-like protein with 3'-5' exonuclease and polymerase domains
MTDKLFTITTLDKLNQVYDYFNENIDKVGGLFAFDTETNGSCPITKTITGYSFSLYENEGFYFPFLCLTDDRGLCTEAPQSIPKEGQNVTGELYECVSPAFKARALDLLAELVKYRTLMHNATFDVIVTRRNFGIDFINSIYCDTMLLKHTLDCDRPHGLKDCAAKYFGESEKAEQEELGGSIIRNGGKWTKTDKWIWYGDLYYVGLYAAKDTCMTLKLFNFLDPQLDTLGLRDFFYTDEVMPLLKYGTIPMKDTGFKIDVNHFKRAKLRLQAEIDDLDTQLREEISDIAGEMEQSHLDKRFPAIPKRDFAEALILEAGLSLPTNPKTGAFSTAKGVIKTWAEQVLKKADEDQIKVIWFVQEECDKVPLYLIHKVQRRLWDEKENAPIINLGSPKQFEYIVGTKWKVKSSKTTKGGDQSFDAAEIQKITVSRMQKLEGLGEVQAQERFEELMEADKLPESSDWFVKYLRKKKLENLVSTFIDAILELAIDGRIHTNMSQHGTNSGRYSSNSPNLQQLPAHSALGMVIKKGFIA